MMRTIQGRLDLLQTAKTGSLKINSADNDRRRDLHSDGQPENGQPENADNGSWEDAEVKPPVDVATAEGAANAGSWLSDLLGSLASRGRYQDTVDRSKANAALGDLKSIDNLEATGDLTAAEARALRDGFSNKRICFSLSLYLFY